MRVITSLMQTKVLQMIRGASQAKQIRAKLQHRIKVNSITSTLRQNIAQSLRNFDKTKSKQAAVPPPLLVNPPSKQRKGSILQKEARRSGERELRSSLLSSRSSYRYRVSSKKRKPSSPYSIADLEPAVQNKPWCLSREGKTPFTLQKQTTKPFLKP